MEIFIIKLILQQKEMIQWAPPTAVGNHRFQIVFVDQLTTTVLDNFSSNMDWSIVVDPIDNSSGSPFVVLNIWPNILGKCENISEQWLSSALNTVINQVLTTNIIDNTLIVSPLSLLKKLFMKTVVAITWTW